MYTLQTCAFRWLCGAGAFSDGKYNITNEFGGTLYEYIGKNKATELMEYVDEINMTLRWRGHTPILFCKFQL